MIRLGMVHSQLEGGNRVSSSGMLPPQLQETDPVVRSVEERVAQLVGIAPHADEDQINLVFRPELKKKKKKTQQEQEQEQEQTQEQTRTQTQTQEQEQERNSKKGVAGQGDASDEMVVNLHLDARLGRPFSAVTGR